MEIKKLGRMQQFGDEERVRAGGAVPVDVRTNKNMTQSIRIFLTSDDNFIVYLVEGMPVSSADKPTTKKAEKRARRRYHRITLH